MKKKKDKKKTIDFNLFKSFGRNIPRRQKREDGLWNVDPVELRKKAWGRRENNQWPKEE